jgi:hypothetical protein
MERITGNNDLVEVTREVMNLPERVLSSTCPPDYCNNADVSSRLELVGNWSQDIIAIQENHGDCSEPKHTRPGKRLLQRSPGLFRLTSSYHLSNPMK